MVPSGRRSTADTIFHFPWSVSADAAVHVASATNRVIVFMVECLSRREAKNLKKIL
jgi:hypothetical protein